ncbi:MAG: hypothetical protein H7836_16665, partial [Magnetococcus sp. YQC-3]
MTELKEGRYYWTRNGYLSGRIIRSYDVDGYPFIDSYNGRHYRADGKVLSPGSLFEYLDLIEEFKENK